MRDEEIIKALRCCADKGCKFCAEQGKPHCKETVASLAWDWIHRQKAEIERLKNECFCLANERDAYKDVLDTAIAEAYEEFAERLKERAEKTKWISGGELVVKDYKISGEDLDNLLAEMESERE